jgi:hypothetical protein
MAIPAIACRRLTASAGGTGALLWFMVDSGISVVWTFIEARG